MENKEIIREPVDTKTNFAKKTLLARIENDFTYHKPKAGMPERYARIREVARSYANELIHLCPQSRELSAALTKLDEVVFWANASIARNE